MLFVQTNMKALFIFCLNVQCTFCCSSERKKENGRRRKRKKDKDSISYKSTALVTKNMCFLAVRISAVPTDGRDCGRLVETLWQILGDLDSLVLCVQILLCIMQGQKGP